MMIRFERSIFCSGFDDQIYDIVDVDFWADCIVRFPLFRPLEVEKAARLAGEYAKNGDFRVKFLKKSEQCPILIYKLYKMGVLRFEEIDPVLKRMNSYILCYYFRKEIPDFQSFIRDKTKPYGFNEAYYVNGDDSVDLFIEYGFPPFSIEYCLKYDDIDVLGNLEINNNGEAIWSMFEWSYKPESLGFLSFSGFFGSIKCFKHLLLNGFHIDDNVRSMVVCSGSLELFHLCDFGLTPRAEFLKFSSIFAQMHLLEYFMENGYDINTSDRFKQTPLHYAAQNSHFLVIEFLINHGADINSINNRHENPLHFSVLKGHLSVVEYLVNRGAQLNTKKKKNCLHYSAIYGNLKIVKYLVEHGASVDENDQWFPKQNN